MNRINFFSRQFKNIFFTPITTRQHWGVILLVACLFIFLPQFPPIDWDLITGDFWPEGLNAYDNPGQVVYPPWGLIILVPYYLAGAEGSRVLSVLVIAWMSSRRNWSLSKFLALALSPFFLVTLSKSNLDILVYVFPILLWESAEDTRWQSVGRGLALSILLVKPQGAVFLWPYLLWSARKDWQGLIKPLLITAVLVIPISLYGSPPLVVKWLHNINNPNPLYEYWWSLNNLSLSTYYSPIAAILILLSAFLGLAGILKWRGKPWSKGHTLSSMLIVSMLLSPYTSQQSFSSALAFVPSWGSFFVQNIVLAISFTFLDYLGYIPWWALLIGLATLYFYQPGPGQDLAPELPESIS